MNQEPRIRYTLVRKVHPPTRANAHDAGLDFYAPVDLQLAQLQAVQPDSVKYGLVFVSGDRHYRFGDDKVGILHSAYNTLRYHPLVLADDTRIIDKIIISPNSRVLIPSGVRVLLEPANSMLMAANKSGIATKKGLIFGAEIVDSPYTGEVHISIINTTKDEVVIEMGQKQTQFIHVPFFESEPEEIPNSLYEEIAKTWGTRGSKAFGSSDKLKAVLDTNDLADIRGTMPDTSLEGVKVVKVPTLDYEDELAICDAQFT